MMMQMAKVELLIFTKQYNKNVNLTISNPKVVLGGQTHAKTYTSFRF